MSSYDHFSKYYDSLMGSTSYNYWKNIVHSYCSHNYIFPPDQVLEIGTGTGNLLYPLAKIGYNVTGIDLSHQMLKIAAGKSPSEAPLVRCRMENLCFKKGIFSCAVAFFEVLNYISDLDKLESFFSNLRSCLKKDFLIFADFITEKKITTFFSEGTFSHRISKDILTVWECNYDPSVKRAEITTTFIDETKSVIIRSVEKHYKYIFSPMELENLFLKLDFEITDVLESFTYKSPNKNTERILYVLKGANNG
ncbi:class I SAM-dependent methyltransferase [bacterium]|nr:class I SAM-dependent methyltransferase [bacterium]